MVLRRASQLLSVVGALCATPFASAIAADVALRAPVAKNDPECQSTNLLTVGGTGPALTCGGDVALSEVVLSAQDTKLKLDACQNDAAARACKEAKGQIDIHPVVGGLNAPLHFIPSLFANQMDDGCFPKQRWMEVSDITDGQAALKEYLAVAKSGAVWNDRFQVVTPSIETPTEQHLATCSVRTIGGVSGPPRNCHTAVILTDKQAFLRVEVSRSMISCQTSAIYRQSGAINFEFTIETSRSPDLFGKTIHELLKNDLGFSTSYEEEKTETGAIDEVRIISTSGIRDTKFLAPGWRESMDLDVYIRTRSGNLEVRAYTQPMVTRYADGNLSALHGTDDAQRNMYASVINTHISDAISKACPGAVHVDDTLVRCP